MSDLLVLGLFLIALSVLLVTGGCDPPATGADGQSDPPSAGRLGSVGANNGDAAFLASEPTQVDLPISPLELYSGLEAHRAVLHGNAIVLDVRNWSVGELPGRLLTDVIELNSGAVVGLPTTISGLKVAVFGLAPTGSKVVVYLRHGPTYFQTAGWADWQAVGELSPANDSAVSSPLNLGPDCYIQLRVDLVSESPKAIPAIKGLTLSFARQAVRRFEPQIEVADSKIERIVPATIKFGYERPDQKDLAWLRESCKLNEVIAGKAGELDQLIALNEWASTRINVRGPEGDQHLGGQDPYPWDLHKIFDLNHGGTVYGHCASYSQLLLAAMTSLNWRARHVANEGYRSCAHEVVEVWVNSLGQWVYFDPSLGTYYTDRAGRPLGILQMHDIFVNFFCEKGKTLRDYEPFDEVRAKDKAAQRRQKLNFADFPAVCHTNDYTYGQRIPWDWTEGQGIMSAGFLQMTPRNNFYSQPNPPFLRYTYDSEGVNGFPCWSDQQTPLWYDESTGKPESFTQGLTRNWFTRERDWNWTLNQASLRLVRTGAQEVTVELGNSQPFFKNYLAEIDGSPKLANQVNSPFIWRLHSGENSLRVDCVDEFGKPGIPSTVRVVLK